MGKVATTIRIEAELRASLNKICVRTGDQTYHIEQALRAYGPIKKLAAKPKREVVIGSGELLAPGENGKYVLPAYLNATAWDEWILGCKKKPSGAAIKKQWKLLEQNTKADQQLIIDASINSGWQGLFPLKGQQRPVEVEGSFGKKHTDPDWKTELLADDTI